MSRLPVRWKVTLAFAATLAVVLGVVGAVMYARFAHDLDETLDRGLRSRAAEITALAARDPAGLARARPSAFEDDESVAQVLDATGAVVAGTRAASAVALTEPVREEVIADRPGDAALDEGVRLLARPLDGGRTLVVGASSDERDEALASLLVLELAGFAIALLLAGAAGYVVAGIALRPVDAMRAEAERITDEPDRRLPVPPVDDELGRLGATLNALLARLGAARARERRFVADAGHELRTPLTILRGEIDVALSGGGDPHAALASAGEETDRLIRLAEDLLVIAQADEGGVPLRRVDVELGVLLRRAADRQRARAAPRELRVEVADGLGAHVDPERLQQALTNLVDNALRHGEGDVVLRAAASGDGVVVAVRDAGPGLPADFVPRALERFSRADAGRGRGGAGLGLAIVDVIARAHGGTVRIEGAEVALELPHRPLIDVAQS